MKILPYNRVVLSLGMTEVNYITIKQKFVIKNNGVDTPRKPGEICMYKKGYGEL